MQRITLTLDQELAGRLKAAAKIEDRSVSAVARRAFAEYFGSRSKAAKTAQRTAKEEAR